MAHVDGFPGRLQVPATRAILWRVSRGWGNDSLTAQPVRRDSVGESYFPANLIATSATS